MGTDRLSGGGAEQVLEDLRLAPLLARLELDLAPEHVDRGRQVDDPRHGLVLPEHGGPVQGGRRDRLGTGDGETG